MNIMISGTLQQHLQYLPYGEVFVDKHVGSFSSPYTFSAKEKDSESGYNYFGARYYTDNLMQWLSVDPMSDKYPSMSPYMYCAGNPIGLIDPNGEDILAYNDYSKRKMKSYFKQLFGNSKMFTFNNNRLEIRDKQFERAYNSSTLDQQKLLDGFNEAINRDEKVIVKVAKNVKGFAFYKYDNPDIPDEPTSLSTLPNMGGGATRWSNDFSSYIIGVDDAVKNNLTTNNPSVMTGTPAATFVHETLDEFLNYFSKGIINNNTPKINQVENHNTALRILKLPERNGEDHQ